ncbi:MAG: hypothetical protein ACR2KL_10290 [Nocardioidaceae bacterium]
MSLRPSLLWYAETPFRRKLQIAADAIAALALVLCYLLGTGVHDVTSQLAGPGRSLESAGADLSSRMSDAGSAAGNVPYVGDSLRVPLDQASEAARSIQAAGIQQQHAVATLATTLGWVAGGVPALLVLALWLPNRLRFGRRAAVAQQLRDTGAGLDVFAFRALARQPVAVLAQLPRDPAAGWRARDPQMIEALAALELRRLGLRTRGS